MAVNSPERFVAASILAIVFVGWPIQAIEEEAPSGARWIEWANDAGDACERGDLTRAAARLDALASPQEWLHGAHAIPVTGAWYGYPRNSGALRKIKTIAINLRSHGDALFISSVYPEGFQTYADVLSGS